MKKYLRPIFTLMLVTIMTCSSTVVCNAISTEQFKHNPQMEEASYVRNAEALKTKAENYVNSLAGTARIGGHKSLSVPLRKQINGDYCGPTSARMVLLYHGIDQTQSYIAGKVGTTTQGTYLYRITNYLNSQVGSGKYESMGTWNLAFANGLEYSIDKGRPLICLVQTSKLPHYNGHVSTHYVVATGYDWSMESGYSTVDFNDPNNNSAYYGRRTCTWSKMSQAINAESGWYIMGS